MKLKDGIEIEVPRKRNFRKLGSFGKVKSEYLPDFFIISPPKTGSTWLSYNLNCHPEIFIPEVKEIKYFSNHWRTEQFNWYLKHFEKAITKKKGDATPSYAILPTHTIQFIKLLMPGLKLIFLMRDAVDRAWSHIKHSYKYCEPGFKSYADDFDSVSDEDLIDASEHDWFLAPADYLGCLNRWLSVFPKDQFYLGFYETIKDDPGKLLVDIFDFLEVQKKVNWSQFRIYETIFAGNRRKLPDNLRAILRSLHQKRTQQLAQFLKEQFNIDIPAYWKKTLAETDRSLSPSLIEADNRGLNIKVSKRLESKSGNKVNFPDVFHGEFTDQRLATILNMDNTHARPLLWGKFIGYNIVRYKGNYFALSRTLGNIDLTQLDNDKLNLYRKNGHCTVRNSFLKTKISIILLIIKKISIFSRRKIIEVYHKS